MSKGMFDRLFKFLVKKCNETLDTQQKRQHFIGVLDIAGFEIFDVSIIIDRVQILLQWYNSNCIVICNKICTRSNISVHFTILYYKIISFTYHIPSSIYYNSPISV